MRFTHLFALVLLGGCLGAARAQQPAGSTSDWSAVTHLVSQERLRVDTWAHGDSCIFVSADENELVCEQRRYVLFIPLKSQAVYRRRDVKRIRESHRIRSGIVGGLIGAGVGAGIGHGLDSGRVGYALLTFTFAELLAFVGVEIGVYTDFLAGPVVYQATGGRP